MIKLNEGNVPLKPSQRRQLMAWLRRCVRFGNRLGRFLLTITLRRTGRQVEVRATVRDAAGEFACHCRQTDWRGAARDLIRRLANHLHAQYLQTLAA